MFGIVCLKIYRGKVRSFDLAHFRENWAYIVCGDKAYADALCLAARKNQVIQNPDLAVTYTVVPLPSTD